MQLKFVPAAQLVVSAITNPRACVCGVRIGSEANVFSKPPTSATPEAQWVAGVAPPTADRDAQTTQSDYPL